MYFHTLALDSKYVHAHSLLFVLALIDIACAEPAATLPVVFIPVELEFVISVSQYSIHGGYSIIRTVVL
jgi:hypothetical protein